MEPTSLIEAVRYFADPQICNAYMRKIKWPDGKPTCPKCGSDNVAEIATRPILQCRACRKQCSYKTGTIFEDSPLGLDKWFSAIFAEAHGGVASTVLARVLRVGQKTAWLMQNRIRQAMVLTQHPA